jgi:hypothetical protein
MVRELHTTRGEILEGQSDDLHPNLRSRLVRKALGNERTAQKSLGPSLLPTPLVLVELASVNALITASLSNVPKPFSHL